MDFFLVSPVNLTNRTRCLLRGRVRGAYGTRRFILLHTTPSIICGFVRPSSTFTVKEAVCRPLRDHRSTIARNPVTQLKIKNKTNTTLVSTTYGIPGTDHALVQTFLWAAHKYITINTAIPILYVLGRRDRCIYNCRNPPCPPLPDITTRLESDVNISTNMTTQPTNAWRYERCSREMQTHQM